MCILSPYLQAEHIWTSEEYMILENSRIIKSKIPNVGSINRI